MLKLISIVLISILSIFINIATANVHRIFFNADVVASSCHAVVETDMEGNNLLTFSTFRKSNDEYVLPRKFTIRLYESGSTVQGCTAFLAGQIATIQFGNPGQLDSGGVVTKGAGDGIRIDVRAKDPQADYRNKLTDMDNIINYPVSFAADGQFNFEAKPIIPADVRAGEYSGS
ncbi:TPA: fimbrial protein, partial [Yersinia enterocolitica]|nr:fimbrial protein [Yersinia enterocolitica]